MNRWKRWRTSILLMLAVLGPGFITANVDNDSGGIYTYATAGAQFGYALLWTMIPMAIMLAFAQEISARMGVVTGKGLSELIREEFGLRITAMLMVGLVLCNLGDVVSEFAGVSSGASLFHISKWISVPVVAVLVWVLVVYGDYKKLEKLFVVLSFLYIAYIITAVLAHPNWTSAVKDTLRLPRLRDLRSPDYLYLSVGLIGATVAPWQQFYLQASVVDKGAPRSQLKMAQTDAIFGSVFSIAVAAFIVIACAATLFVGNIHDIRDAADAAQSLKPLGGQYASILFAFGLLNASIFAASILPLSTAYTVCESLGFESGLSKKFREAPVFYWLYTGLLILGAAVILISKEPPAKLAVLSQVLNGVLLPAVLVFMLVLVNKKSLMGARRNGKTYNAIAWTMTALATTLTVVMLLGMLKQVKSVWGG
jgi:Mn2+/Fe2+ NRAMP family transporter